MPSINNKKSRESPSSRNDSSNPMTGIHSIDWRRLCPSTMSPAYMSTRISDQAGNMATEKAQILRPKRSVNKGTRVPINGSSTTHSRFIFGDDSRLNVDVTNNRLFYQSSFNVAYHTLFTLLSITQRKM